LKALALALVLIATSAVHAEDFNRTLHTSATPHLSVSTGSGYIHLSRGSGDEIRIIGHVHQGTSWFGGDSSDRVHRIVSNPPIEQAGDTITIGHTNDRDLYRNIGIDYDITLPSQSSVEANSGSGDIRAEALQGSLTAHTGSGDIQVQDTTGSLRLDTGSGSLRAHNIHGNSSLRTGSGDIELQQNGPGDTRADTGSGSIRIHGISGALNAITGSGDIEVEGKITSDWNASTGSGSLRFSVGNDAHFNLDASTGSGSIHTSQSIASSGTANSHHLYGTANGGGPSLHLRTGSGDIQIR
jgi:DUF4097 and DUF4098 domain-containing protein YvlB